ncbi:hypothetical protein [Kocuria salina]|uniref:hypothetical protein n=1 Tax=Kocuria salina TaxID=1929416 RepID=UPI0015942A7A|nr:hypothetical protein [Kocuria salina]
MAVPHIPPTAAERRWYLRVWYGLQEPRSVTVVQTFIYVATALAGVLALIDPPLSIRGDLGEGLLYAMAGLWLVGGITGAVGCPPGWWVVERAAVWPCAAGFALYGSSVLGLHFTESGNRLVQAIALLILVLSFIKRFFTIRGAMVDPARL